MYTQPALVSALVNENHGEKQGTSLVEQRNLLVFIEEYSLRILMDSLHGKHVFILGLGKSGYAAAELAATYHARVTVVDDADRPELRERAEALSGRGVCVHLNWTASRFHEPVDLAVMSPGISPDSPLGQLANALNCAVVSELEFGYRFCSCPILAITGTNGKTTVTELLTHCLRHCGFRVAAAGNVGTPLSEIALRSAVLDYLVVEVSSFQLEAIDRFQPYAAVILNITSDHLDRHGTMSIYREAKLSIFRNMRNPRRMVIRCDLAHLRETNSMAGVAAAGTFALTSTQGATFSIDEEGFLVNNHADGSHHRLLHRDAIGLVGSHNHENALATLALSRAAGISPEIVALHIPSFVPAAHRLEFVATHHGVQYINDSKATNPDATKQAILTVARTAIEAKNILLIAGGLDKHADFSDLLPVLEKHVKKVFLIGRCRERLAKQWHEVVSCEIFISLGVAFEAALGNAHCGDTILLAPGCASQDMFADYAHRGQVFCDLVKRSVGE